LSEMIPGTKIATVEDARAVIQDLREFLNRHDYHPGLSGSTVRAQSGNDIDVLIVAGATAILPAIEIANMVVKRRGKLIHNFEVFDDESRSIGFVITQKDRTVLDGYVYGLPDEGVASVS